MYFSALNVHQLKREDYINVFLCNKPEQKDQKACF
jgi:hypothetical protein